MARSLQELLAKLLVFPPQEGETSKASYAAADQVQMREFGVKGNRQMACPRERWRWDVVENVRVCSCRYNL
jgi:hypothetical protein